MSIDMSNAPGNIAIHGGVLAPSGFDSHYVDDKAAGAIVGDADNDSASPGGNSKTKTDLCVQVESPTSSPGKGSLNGSVLYNWQQPYSELSRFPSASYRFRGKDWPPDGSRFIIPLPSPLDSRSRSFSDAASEASSAASDSNLGPSTSTDLASRSTSANISSNGRRATPTRSRTANFFETMDAAFSPPPPPKMPLASDHSKRKSLDGSASLSTAKDSFSPPSEASSSFERDSPDMKRSYLSASMPASTGKASSSSTFQPLSNLPSAFRSEVLPLGHLSSNLQGKDHKRISSNGSTSAIPTIPSLLGRHTVMSDSPLPSPTESISMKWPRMPPGRLPTLLGDDWSSVQDPGEAAPVSSPNIHAASPPDNRNTHASTSIQKFSARECECGAILDEKYEVLRNLGIGAFSKVVLAKRMRLPRSEEPPAASSSSPNHVKHKKLDSATSPRDLGIGHARIRSVGTSLENRLQRGMSMQDTAQDWQKQTSTTDEDLVAIKLIDRNDILKNDRMRISIMREVEVLKHIRHPSLVHLTASFETTFHTGLVLEYSPGGELFDYLANHHHQTSEALARRIFGELADVLGWMHSIGLVHRDIKLENILLTSRPFSASPVSTSYLPLDLTSLPSLPTPFVKLTDFGLSRFIIPSSPYLETRCGSEEYAAPELIMGKRYDGRQTDAWALGVVLYAIITGSLPFVEAGTKAPNGAPLKTGISPFSGTSVKSRRSYLLKIAKAEYSWPVQPNVEHYESIQEESHRLVSDEVKKIVAGLLTRDPKKRINVEDVWDYEWMLGPGTPEKRSIRGGNLEGVSLSEFGRDDVEVLTAEVPEIR